MEAETLHSKRSSSGEAESGTIFNPLTLAFTGSARHLESHFLEHYCTSYLRFLRMCIYFSMTAYSSVGLLDALLFPDYKYTLWLIRYALVMPFFIIAIYLTYSKCYPRIWQYCNFVLTLITGLSALAMIMIVSSPGNFRYIQVIVIVLFFNYALIRTRFIIAALAGGIIYASYVIAVHMFYPTPWDIRLTNSYYLTMVVIIGMFISYAIEKSERSNYHLSYILKQQKEKLDIANRTLEQRVQERTEQLEQQIEERKRVEETHRTLEQRFRQSQKMDAIGTLAGGIAHDFNNVLAAMIGYTELIRDTPPTKDARTLQNIEEIIKAGSRAKNLIRQILTFSRQNEQEVSPVQISLIVKEVSKLIRATLPATIKIRRNIRSNSMVMADPTQIHQVIMNLCTNAAYVMQAGGGDLGVSLTEINIDAEFAQQHPSLIPGPHIRLSVSDTGPGIPNNLKERIFEPFFTTKKQGEGTGLGLSVVHGIVKNHNGAIGVYSEPGQGTTFSIYLPITECRETCPAPLDLSQLHGTERILYVDDEKQIASMFYLKLQNLGYDIKVMTDSLEAWEFFESDPQAVDMIISDMTMPNLTGAELAQRALSLRPDLPVILCTGFSNAVSEEKVREIGVAAMLTKPIFTREIATAIRRVFDIEKVPTG